IPAGAQIGPMVIGSILHVSGLARMDLPDVLLEGSYALIGWYIGLRFTRETVRETLHALPGILAATFGVIVLCGFWALALTRI
ncbi:AbrB family transcriptional regulator, partial [Klebsiella aerogenes]